MIKKLFSSAALAIAVFAASAQKPATIKGQFELTKFKPGEVTLYKVDNGTCLEIAKSNPDKDGQFGFLFYPSYEGLYVIGRGNPGSPNSNFEFYFKAGDNLSVTLTDWNYKLSGKDNSKENAVLYTWHQLIDSIYQKAINFTSVQSTYVDFFPQLESTAAKVKPWLSASKTGNAKFDAALPCITEMDMDMIATNFLQTPRSAHPSVEEYSPFYATIKTTDITQTTAKIYNYPWGIRTMNGMAMLDYNKSGQGFGKGFSLLKSFSPYIANDTLKGDLLLNQAASIKDYGQYKDLMAEYGKYVLSDAQKQRQVNIEAPLMTMKKGDDAYNFSYEDRNGKTVSLSDMKGKVVLVDVWATWCGPCKAQIPYLKTLEEEMNGKDVQFVSISVDEAKDKQKWLTFIDTAKLGGTQLFAGGWSQENGIAKYYKISGIPRFMVFDKNGKIVSIDSPRPSDPALKELLEKTLED